MTNAENQSSSNRVFVEGYRSQVREAGLYIVATPIGNLGDISIRALDTLAHVDIVLCEDTRVTGKLLKHYEIEATLEAYHDHSDEKKRASIVERVEKGMRFALVSDAGMPLISDPGYKLVVDLRERGLMVTSIAGANAPLAALQLSGMPSDAFSFLGFLPSKQGARCKALRAWESAPGSLIAFESAARLKDALADIGEVLSGRRVAVVREISKKFEEVCVAFPGALIADYSENGLPKGEIVLVIEPPVQKELSDDEIQGLLKKALAEHGTKEAAAQVALETGLSKKMLYEMALKVSKL